MSFDVRNRRVVVMGAGRSGRAAARLLRSRGAEVTLTDTDASALSFSALLGCAAMIAP